MKISLALSLMAILLTAAIGWHDHQRFGEIRARYQRIAAEAAAAGIFLASDGTEPGSSRPLKRSRPGRNSDTRQLASELITAIKDFERMRKEGTDPEQTEKKRIFGITDRLVSLDAAGVKDLIAILQAEEELPENLRRGVIRMSVMALAVRQPRAALALYAENSDFLNRDTLGKELVSASLTGWARNDPQGALGWYRDQGTKFPEILNDETRRGLIVGVAKTDPETAFRLIRELEVDQAGVLLENLARAAKSPETRTATLAGLRDYLQTAGDPATRASILKNEAYRIFRGAAEDGFEASSGWFASENLGAELPLAMSAIADTFKNPDAAKWLDWMGRNLPADQAAAPVGDLVRRWTERDYRAAGEWLASQPDGDTRNIAVRSYVHAISPYEPTAAEDWALTLPEGAQRQETLLAIFRNWPANDDAAAQAFADRHGLR